MSGPKYSISDVNFEQILQMSESNEWKERRLTPLRQLPSNPRTIGCAIMENYQFKTLASFLPDEIINNTEDFKAEKCHVCLLYVKMNGITELSEKYIHDGRYLPSHLTTILNMYLGAVVQEILSSGGDILKISGDYLIAVWRCPFDSVKDHVHEAIDCALGLQRDYSSYQTDSGIVLQIKVIISTGPVTFDVIEDKHASHLVCIGKAMDEAQTAEYFCYPGDIAVTPSVRLYITGEEYIIQDLDDDNTQIHAKVLGIGPNWRKVAFIKRLSNVDHVSSSSSEKTLINVMPSNNEDLSIRSSVISIGGDWKQKNQTLSFLVPPLARAIFTNQVVEDVIEMHLVVLMIVNVTFTDVPVPIRTLQEFFRIINRVVIKNSGFIANIITSQKDMKFVIPFGISSFQHERECKSALRTSRCCHADLRKLPEVKSITIAVMTGKAYCGLIGHILRRDYTIISSVISKASSLVTNYPNKIICDKITTTHSKLESEHFVLLVDESRNGCEQEPVYEYVHLTDSETEFVHPILNREQEIEQFLSMFESYSHFFMNYIVGKSCAARPSNMLIIDGDEGQGKTRLLNELVYTISEAIPIIKFMLSSEDSEEPFQTTRRIFEPLLEFSESNRKMNEEKILERLGNMPASDFICAFNKPLNTSFEENDLYNLHSDEEKQIILEDMFKQLAQNSFDCPHLIAIDNGEYIDEETWNIMYDFLDISICFFVITVKRNHPLGVNAERTTKHPNSKVIRLQNIDQCYYTTLVSQILNVEAIPTELESSFKETNRGNPRCAERFISNILENNGLVTRTIGVDQVKDFNLVFPNISPLDRLPQTIPEKNKVQNNNATKILDSNTDIKAPEKSCTKEDCNDNKKLVVVCVLAPHFDFNEVPKGISKELKIFKSYENLPPYEKYLLKCAAILGKTFSRDLLFYVFSSKYYEKYSMRIFLAIQTLFELRILSCANRMKNLSNNSIQSERRKDLRARICIKCDCPNLEVTAHSHLPKYTFCGSLHFRSKVYQDAIYKLLTEMEKIELHMKAFKYLCKHGKKCSACGNGPLNLRLLFTQKTMENRVKKNKTEKGNAHRIHEGGDAVLSPRTNKTENISPRTDIEEIKSITGSLPAYPNRDYPESTNQMLAFPSFFDCNFANCQCGSKLRATYRNLVDHANGSGQYLKMLENIINYAVTSFEYNHYSDSFNLLRDAIRFLQISSHNLNIPQWEISLIEGKCFALLGDSHLKLGEINEGYKNYHVAMVKFGSKFPTSHLTVFLKLYTLKFKQTLGLYASPELFHKHHDTKGAYHCDSVSQCLTGLYNVYKIRNMWKEAELAGIWALSKALENQMNFVGICECLANMLYICQRQKKQLLFTTLEAYAIRLCQKKKVEYIERRDLVAVIVLYQTIFSSRFFHSKFEDALYLGHTILRISRYVGAGDVSATISSIFTLLIYMKSIMEAVSLLHDLEFYSNENENVEGQIRFCSACLTLQLETGFATVTQCQCLKRLHERGIDLKMLERNNWLQKFINIMWLWYLRNDQLNEASSLYGQIVHYLDVHIDYSVDYFTNLLYVYEGLLLTLVKTINRYGESPNELEQAVLKMCRKIEALSQFAEVLLPRFYHLRAYYEMINNEENRAIFYLNKASQCAQACGNELELGWIEYSRKCWFKTLPIINAEAWQEHCRATNNENFVSTAFDGSIIYYTLPRSMY